eukprot:TRINITY_DN74635_c0_g1_i1.p1 TRINITY_DN74635_c0_g1~~TRINITY_DN74635_c0_g1_i1.p1  ORF type:complete len:227 (+),score=71.99 TRINITY_DN74635_c0_g1_i1:57-737(+)
MQRKLPNILVTGTPGTGKTSTCARLAAQSGGRLTHVDVGALVKAKSLHEGKDDEYDAFILDEDKVCDELEPLMQQGGRIVDFHGCDFFPERWFDLVVVLRADNTVLYDRLAKRGYKPEKITENVECEIMMVCLDEARESYKEEIVVEMQSDSDAHMTANLTRIAQLAEAKAKELGGSLEMAAADDAAAIAAAADAVRATMAARGAPSADVLPPSKRRRRADTDMQE